MSRPPRLPDADSSRACALTARPTVRGLQPAHCARAAARSLRTRYRRWPHEHVRAHQGALLLQVSKL